MAQSYPHGPKLAQLTVPYEANLAQLLVKKMTWSADMETGVVQHAFTQNCERRLSLEFVDNLELNGLRQLVTEPTRESGTYLDLVLANIPGTAALCDSMFTSDHHALSVKAQVIVARRHLPTRSRAFNYTEKKLHPESYFWSFSTIVSGIIKR